MTWTCMFHEPDGNHIYYGNKSSKLDVDMNVHQLVRDPVENVRWVKGPRDGRYVVKVNQFTRRESVDVGFTVEVECGNRAYTFRSDKSPAGARVTQTVVEIVMKSGNIHELRVGEGIVSGSASREKWGLKTLDLVRVNSIVLSPNHWDKPMGNKHWFFILDGCLNPDPTRGIYNEFLRLDLEKHRKVFEILGDKTKCPYATEQLSGLGFSSTRKDKVTVVAMGPKLNKPYTIVF